MFKYKRIGLFVGHSILANGTCTSADGRKNGGKLEYAICKELATEMKKWFDKIEQPCDVIIVPEKKYNSGYEDDYKLPIANSGKYDLIIELHLNSFDGTAAGAITANKIASGAITASMITSGTLDASKVNVTNLNASNIKSGTISADRLDANTIVSKVNGGTTEIATILG